MIYVDVNVFKNDKTFDLKFDETMSVSQMLTELKAYIELNGSSGVMVG